MTYSKMFKFKIHSADK